MSSRKLEVILSVSPDFVIIPPSQIMDHPRGVTKDQLNCLLLIKSFKGHGLHIIRNGITYDINGKELSIKRVDLMVHIGDVFQNNRIFSVSEYAFKTNVPITWIAHLKLGLNDVLGKEINICYENLALDKHIPSDSKSQEFGVVYGSDVDYINKMDMDLCKYTIIISNDFYELTCRSPSTFLSHTEFYNQSHIYRSNREFAAGFCSSYDHRKIYIPKISLRYFLYLIKCAKKRYFSNNTSSYEFYKYCESICLNQ